MKKFIVAVGIVLFILFFPYIYIDYFGADQSGYYEEQHVNTNLVTYIISGGIAWEG